MLSFRLTRRKLSNGQQLFDGLNLPDDLQLGPQMRFDVVDVGGVDHVGGTGIDEVAGRVFFDSGQQAFAGVVEQLEGPGFLLRIPG